MIPGLVQAEIIVRFYDDILAFNIDRKLSAELPFVGDRKLYLLVDMTLQETRTVCRAEKPFSVSRSSAASVISTSLALCFHLAFEFAEIDLGDLADLVHRQRREDDDLVDTVAELRREPRFGSLHHFAFGSA